MMKRGRQSDGQIAFGRAARLDKGRAEARPDLLKVLRPFVPAASALVDIDGYEMKITVSSREPAMNGEVPS